MVYISAQDARISNNDNRVDDVCFIECTPKIPRPLQKVCFVASGVFSCACFCTGNWIGGAVLGTLSLACAAEFIVDFDRHIQCRKEGDKICLAV